MAHPKLNLIVWKHLPEKGTPGDLYFVKDGVQAGEIYIAARNGMLCPVPDIFNIVVPIGPQGPAGRDGKDGRDGIDGKDGAAGPKGDKGDVLYIGADEAQQELEAAKRRIRDYQARVRAVIAAKLDSMGDSPVYKLAAAHLRDVDKAAEKI